MIFHLTSTQFHDIMTVSIFCPCLPCLFKIQPLHAYQAALGEAFFCSFLLIFFCSEFEPQVMFCSIILFLFIDIDTNPPQYPTSTNRGKLSYYQVMVKFEYHIDKI